MSTTSIPRTWMLAAAAAAVLVVLPAFVGRATAAQQMPPTNTSPPTISGTPLVGEPLTADEGTWTGSRPIRFAFQWLRCDARGANCAAIQGATDQRHTLSSADANRRLRVRVTATNRVGSRNVTSGATALVRTPATSVPIESVVPPERLVIASVTFSPNRIRSLTQRTFVAVRVTTTAGTPVRGALVFLRSTPLVTSTPPERPTGPNGFAEFEVVPQADLRLFFRPGYNLQFFVRARKAGENLLAGVSTRRLVQVPLAPGG